ncbi:hypothetical protein A3F06_03785 [candidate division TM6 bacterium RIFCSPHIGHO2_12_FULL_36_22]|nr:MAG: hypothetical protein A3F06_03785 [candidate division TM6 bacterium RIFCSPHIGHO2_12_FULL_36_22]
MNVIKPLALFVLSLAMMDALCHEVLTIDLLEHNEENGQEVKIEEGAMDLFGKHFPEKLGHFSVCDWKKTAPMDREIALYVLSKGQRRVINHQLAYANEHNYKNDFPQTLVYCSVSGILGVAVYLSTLDRLIDHKREKSRLIGRKVSEVAGMVLGNCLRWKLFTHPTKRAEIEGARRSTCHCCVMDIADQTPAKDTPEGDIKRRKHSLCKEEYDAIAIELRKQGLVCEMHKHAAA